MDPIEIVFRFLAILFWITAIGSPLCFVVLVFSFKYLDKVALTVVDCVSVRHYYEEDGRTGSFKTYDVTYSFSYQGEDRRLTKTRRNNRVVGSKETGYFNPKKPDILIDKESMRFTLILFAIFTVVSPPILIYINQLLANM
jgi:hypothetical protein